MKRLINVVALSVALAGIVRGSGAVRSSRAWRDSHKPIER